jgi:ribosome-associated protein
LKLNKADSLKLARLCCAALEEKKAGDLRVIDVTDISSITNLIVIATATSEPHVRALRVELEKALDSAEARIVGTDTASESGWAVMDAFDVMIHIFTSETRARYKLENLWRDGDEVSVKALLAGKGDTSAPKKVVRRSAKKPAKTAKEKPAAAKKAKSRK